MYAMQVASIGNNITVQIAASISAKVSDGYTGFTAFAVRLRTAHVKVRTARCHTK
jgi:hypothetical protein